MLSSNTQIETHDGKLVDVVMRGATLTAGGTAEAISRGIDRKIFAHARRLLTEWSAAHEKMYGKGSWAAAGGPSPESIGLHRLSEETLLMSDTCNAARACKRLVAVAAVSAGKEAIGEEAWVAMTEQQRDAKVKVYVGECHAHLRNIIINAMQLRATESLKDELRDSLSEFTSFDRMSTDINDLIRAVFKELHAGGEYAKGKGREFWAWVEKHHPSAMVLPFECTNGSRQDISFDGAVPIFANRKVVLEFLKGLLVPGANNTLEKFLWRVLSCNEMTAALRVNTLWRYIFSEPARWLSGKAGALNNWSIDSASGVLDLIEQAMVKVAADGHTLLDPDFDPFRSIAEQQLAFAAERRKQQQRVWLAHDKTPYHVHERILSEARSPAGAGNAQATQRVVKLAEEMANAALAAMRDPRRAICSLLTSQDGEFSIGKDTSKHKATAGAHVTNCRVESNFGCMDILMRMFRNSTVENMSGIAQQMRNQDFERPANVDHGRGRKRKQQAAAEEGGGGFFHSGLTPELQQSLVEYTRGAAAGAAADGRLALSAHSEEKLQRREDRVQALLNATIQHHAEAKELFNDWMAQRQQLKDRTAGRTTLDKVDIARALQDAAGKPLPEAQQLQWLRKQISMRVLGGGWTQYITRWSSNADRRIGTVAHLTELLEEIVLEEKSMARLRRIPTEAQPPHHQLQDLGQLGTMDADAKAIASRALFSAEELEAKAAALMQRRVEQGISDPVEGMQPEDAPAFDQRLVGKRLEVLWKYHEEGTGKPHMIWCSGRVVRVADGLTNKRSSRAQKVLPGGALLWAWDADPQFEEAAGEQWLVLLPKKWNPKTQGQVYSWRYDPRELGAACAPPADPRRKNARRVVDDD